MPRPQIDDDRRHAQPDHGYTKPDDRQLRETIARW
jgi:hypothetical protein